MTVYGTAAETDSAYAAESAGRNFAVNVCAPGASVFVLNSAVPEAASARPSSVVPSRKATFPAAAGGVTAAFRVIAVPAGAVAAGVAVSAVVVAAASWTAQESPVTRIFAGKYLPPTL